MHPLAKVISSLHIQQIQTTYILAQRVPDDLILLNSGVKHPFVNYLSFHHLLQHGQMTDDSILQAFLQCLRFTFPQTVFLNTNFHRKLSQNGWASAYGTFCLHSDSSRYAKKTQSKPTINSDVILIPFHVNGCHWIALA